MKYEVIPVSNERFRLAESPFYDPLTGITSFVDILEGKLHLWHRDGTKTSLSFGEEIGAAVPAKDGGFIVAGTSALFKTDGGSFTGILPLTDIFKGERRCNDAKADPSGRLFFGTCAKGENKPSESLYSYDGKTLAVRDGKTLLSNGMAWSRDKEHFFFSDSLAHALFVYDHDPVTGELSGKRVLTDLGSAIPDGLTIDINDNIFLAIWGGAKILKIDYETGEISDRIEVPAKNVTSCCFCNDELDTLLITSSGEDLDGPFDGMIFTCKTDTRGLPPDRFGV